MLPLYTFLLRRSSDWEYMVGRVSCALSSLISLNPFQVNLT